ncbi:hypothetical protein P167DRAFT_492682, partial [Morchella conica CCBAS932]
VCVDDADKTTGKKSWFGCGSHIPSVMDPVPKEEWCTCEKPADSEYPPIAS